MLQQNNTTRPGPKQRQPAHQGKPSWQPKSLKDFDSRFKPVLAVLKFNRPNKFYRLIWRFGGRAWLCRENLITYKKRWGKGGAMEAGEALAKIVGVRFER